MSYKVASIWTRFHIIQLYLKIEIAFRHDQFFFQISIRFKFVVSV